MKKKLIISFLIVLAIGISFAGIFSIRLTRNIILNSLEDKLISDAKLLAVIFKPELNKGIKNFDEIAEKYSKITNTRVTILSDDGAVIGDSNGRIGLDKHDESYVVKEALDGRLAVNFSRLNTQNQDMLNIAIPVGDGSIPNAAIKLSTSLTNVQTIKYRYFGYIIFIILIGLSTAFIIAYRFVKKITEPINEITNISSNIAEGRYDRRVKINSEDDEVGRLADAFNYMAEKLEETITDLSDKKNKLEAILKSMENGVIAVDNTGRIMLANPSAYHIFGLKQNILGKHILDVFRNADFEEVVTSFKGENREIKLNYTEKKVLKVKAVPIKDAMKNDKKIGVVVVIQDITEMKQLEQMRSEFVANVSHELKTPLTSIKGFAETLKSGAIDDAKARDKFLDIINIEADRLTRLINDILTLSELENKPQSVNFEKIDINAVIEQIEDMMRALAGQKNISIAFEKNCKNSIIMGNHDKVKQLFINLIDNAVKYTPENGRVFVRTYNKEESVYIEIEDTGIGIPKEHLPRLFERFYRVDKGRSRALGGTGLGLAIVKHIVISMGGEITVESEQGKGSLFTVILPNKKE